MLDMPSICVRKEYFIETYYSDVKGNRPVMNRKDEVEVCKKKRYPSRKKHVQTRKRADLANYLYELLKRIGARLR